MAGSDVLERWRSALVDGEHRIPVIVVRQGRLLEANLAARSFFTHVETGMPVEELFDVSCRDKLRAFLGDGASGVTVELQVVQTDRPPTAAKFLRLDMPDGQLLIVAGSQD